MSTGNHLTIRDYFDQVLIGNQKPRKTFSPSGESEGASGSGMFQRILTSHQMPEVRNTNVTSTGLTIADYLANPLYARGQYHRPLDSSSSETKTDKSTDRSTLAATESTAEKTTRSSQPATKHLQLPRRSVAMATRKQTDAPEQQKIEMSIHKAAGKYNLPPELIKGVIRAESNFQIDAVSRSGARGLMQLMPATAKELGVTKPFDIDQNIDGGSRYLRKMLDSFGGDVKLALAAYNAGPGTVRKYEGNVPFQETIQYIDRVLRFSEQTA